MRIQLGLLGIGALLSSLACSSDGGGALVDEPEGNFVMNTATAQALGADPAIRDELAEVLTEYFGEPKAPRYAVLEEWGPLGFDPNLSPLEAARPEADPGGPSVSAIVADNRTKWAGELSALEQGEFESIGPWAWRSTMSRAWRKLKSQRGELEAAEFKVRATALFAGRYPDLREAAEMYVPHCNRCHGREGDGDGTLSHRQLPKPRSFGYGVFKFLAVEGSTKPRRMDLVQTLEHGLPGTAMPGFKELSLAEISSLSDYVRYLAIRGEVERLMISVWDYDEVWPRESVAEMYALVWERWLDAADSSYVVSAPPFDPDPARLALGDALFHDALRGNCMSCHGDDGKGNGPSAIRYDADGKSHPLLLDDWGAVNLPHDLTDGLFRGGSSREDVYRRIYSGIPGTPMPALGQSTNAEGEPFLSESEMWALVDYVISLSGRGSQ